MKKLVSSVALVFFTSFGQAHAETLAQVFDAAQVHDPTYRAAFGTYQANKEVWSQAFAQMLPSVSGSWSTTGVESGFSSLGGYNLESRQLTLSQPVLHLDHWVQLAKSSAQAKQVTANYSAALQDLIMRVAQKYFDVLIAEDNLSFSRSQRQTFSRHLEQTQQRFEVGLIAITDVHDAKARHDNAVAQEIAADNTLADEVQRLQELTGVLHQALTPLPTHFETPMVTPVPADSNAWVKKALENNWSIQSAYYAKRAGEKEVWRVRTSGHMPTLDLDASFKRGNSTPPLDHNVDTKSIGLTVRLPIFQGGKVFSQTREAKGNRLKLMADYDKAVKSVISQTNRAYRGVFTQISQVASLKQAVISNEKALEATEAAYEVGTRTIVDVLDAQTNLLSAKRDSANAHYNYFLELLRLKEAAGTLTPHDIYTISNWLEGELIDDIQ